MDGRGSRVPTECRTAIRSEMLPCDFAVGCQRTSCPTEPRVNQRAVTRGTRRREVVLVVNASERAGSLEPVLPEPLAVRERIRLDDKECLAIVRSASGDRALARRRRIPALSETRMAARSPHAASNLGRDDDAIADDDRRRDALAAKRSRPRDVLLGTPLQRQIRVCRDAGPLRTAPLRPVLGVRAAWRQRYRDR